MRKSIVIISIYALACSCGLSDDSIHISSNKCWGRIPIEGKIKGSAIIYYFPGQTTFAANSKCPEKTIPLSLMPQDAKRMKYLFSSFSNNADNVGISLTANLTGTLYQNHGNNRVLMKVTLLSISSRNELKVISMKDK